MRCGILWICGLLMLAGSLVGCGAAPDGSAASPADEAVTMSADPDDAGAIAEAPDEDLSWEMTNAGAENSPPPPEETDNSSDPKFPPVAASEAPASTNEDWPTFAPRRAPYGTRGPRSAPVEISPPVIAEADAAPAPDRPAESVAFVDEIVSRLDYGTAGFYTPTELPWGETFVQEVVLSPKDTPEELRTALSNPTAPAEFSRLQVANRMEARLTGSGFDIEPLSEPVQAITSHRPTKWRFKITPVKSGPQELHLSLLAHIDIDGRDAPLVVETKDALIEVDITVPQRLAGMFQAHWKWLWAAVVVPTIGYFYRRKTGRKPPEQPIPRAKAA